MVSRSLHLLSGLISWCCVQSFCSPSVFGVHDAFQNILVSSPSKISRGGHAFFTSHDERQSALQSTLLPSPTSEAQQVGGFEKDGSSSPKCEGPAQSYLTTKPIVLVGFSGAGNELDRLADSIIEKYHGASPNQLEGTTENEEDIDMSTMVSAVPLIGRDERGIWTLSPDDLKEMISAQEDGISKKDVVVVDFGHPLVSDDEGASKESLRRNMLDSLEYLKSEEKCLVVYVNVDAEAGRMAPIPREMKETTDLEERLLELSHYEVAIRDEGLDPIALSEMKVAASEGEENLAELTEQQIQRWEGVEDELIRLVAHANLPKAEIGSERVQKLMGKNTFFLSLSFDHVSKASPYIAAMCQDVDAIELRVDLLKNNFDRHNVLHQLQLLRHMCRPHAIRAPAMPCGTTVIDDAIPIVYTVRTAHQAGTHPDDEEGIKRMFDLLQLGLRAGVEVLDVESAWDPELTSDLLDRAETSHQSTMILGSHHVVGREVAMPEAVELFQNCALAGRAHAAKVVLSLEEGHEEQAAMALDAGNIASQALQQAGKRVIPNISLILGEVGQQSRVFNPNFTPVTHESLPMVAAPGQLSAKQLMNMRIEQGLVEPQRYAILGHNIAYSVSPQMQGGAFEAAGLPHTFGRADVEDVKEFVEGELFTSADFGGAAVTIPHKQSIIPYVDELSDAAKEIGAVNTLVAKYDKNHPEERIIFGDNTDWLGISNPLKRKLDAAASSTNASKKNVKGAALIIGGGGTARAAAYAAKHLGLERIYFNRTPSKAEELAQTFGGHVVQNLSDVGDGSLGAYLSSSDDGLLIKAVISTLPAAAGFELPTWLADGDNKPQVVLDVNYKPYHTPLIDQCDRSVIETIRGSEMLWEQGVGQFEMWTGRLAPYRVMKRAVLQNCLPKEALDEL